MSFALPILAGVALALAAIAGLLFGSFLNVCIARLPGHRSIVAPRSRCPGCDAQIRAYDNIPIASWIWLRGRCRDCGTRISIQYPLVELATALLFVGCVLQTGIAWQSLIDAVACFFLLGLAVMDAQTMLLPDSFTLAGLGIAIALKTCLPGVVGRIHVAWNTLAAAAIAAGLLLVVWALYWLARRRQGVGMGDVKLMAMIGAFLGLPLTLLTYLVGVLAAAIFALTLLARHKARRSDPIPFGSFLAGAAIFAIFAGRSIVAWYLGRLR